MIVENINDDISNVLGACVSLRWVSLSTKKHNSIKIVCPVDMYNGCICT